MTDTLVTIITVTYNSEKTISRTIESVLNQDYPHIEYLIIDGASKDRTAEIARSYQEKFKDGKSIKVISEPDRGMYDALNKGAKLAQGEIIGQINSDDWYEPYAVSKMVGFYHQTGYDMAYADLRMIYPDGSSWIKHSKVDKFVNTRHWSHPTQFTKKSVLLEHPYPVECMSDDLDLLLYIRSHNKHVEVLNEVIANFTVEGMSHSKSWKEIQDRIKTKTRIYRRYGYSFLHTVDVSIVEIGKFILEKGKRRKADNG